MFILPPYSRWITTSPPVVPKLYWDAYSQEERIKRICCRIHSIEQYLDYLNKAMADLETDLRKALQKIIDDTNAALDDAINEMRIFVDESIDDMRAWVEAQTFSMNVWDVTTGAAINSVPAMRRLFFDVTVHGCTVGELATSARIPSVQALSDSGWNVRALAVIGAQVLDANNPQQWVPTGASGDAFDAGRLAMARVDDEGFVVV